MQLTAALLAYALPRIELVPEALAAALDPSIEAVERAYRLVRNEGVPFREAYRCAREG